MNDFFISYNNADVQWAKWVAGILDEDGSTTIIQAWDFKKTIIILSQSYLESEYCQAEWSSIFNCDSTGKKRQLIPIRISDIEPKGLLASIIYIDLFAQEEKVAIEKLLNGVGYSENPRAKPEFPSHVANYSFADESKNSVTVFLFELDEDNKGKFPLSTKNRLREWYFNEHKTDFKVVINDKRQLVIIDHLKEINEKLQHHQDLTIQEETIYGIYKMALKKCEHESLLKEKAIEFFLKDLNLQSYLCINSYLELLDFVKNILDYDYYDQKKYCNSQYISLDIYLDPAPKECRDHFVVCIDKKQIDKHLGDHARFNLFGLYVIDLGHEIIKDIAVEFYIFLSEEIIDYDYVQLVQNKKVLNLLSYHVGLH